MLSTHKHQATAGTGRLYVSRREGGRGPMQIKGAYIAEIIKLEEYVEHAGIQ
jgi:hypothetical protein